MLDGCTPWPREFVDRYVSEGVWRREAIVDAIAASARHHPDAVAVSDSARRLTYAELLAEAARYCETLRGEGLRANDRVIFQLPNCVEFASLALACFANGLIPVMAMAAHRRAEIEHIAALTDARAIAIAPQYRGFDHAALAREIRSRRPSLRSIFSTAPSEGCIALSDASSGASFEIVDRDPFDAAIFLLSGGTTGLPKLIPRTHADYLYNARECARACALSRDSRVLIALPAGHNFPLGCPGWIGALLTGGSAHFAQSTDPAEIASMI